jgi:hypothetical protein
LTCVCEFCVPCMRHRLDTSTCSPRPSSGYRGRPLREPCGSPPSSVPWAHKTARLPVAATSGFPWQQVSRVEGCSLPVERPSCSRDPVRFGLGGTHAHRSREVGSSPGFTGNPLESMPRARDSGDPAATSHSGCADTALRLVNSVGIAKRTDVGAESSWPAFLLCTLRTRQSPGKWQHSLPACPLRL